METTLKKNRMFTINYKTHNKQFNNGLRIHISRLAYSPEELDLTITSAKTQVVV